ncbi:hypothetical protein [Nocardia sp.]|uniref:hypothetical protein n=1 Tax=Nocardia sp. TaxID=1821 RepID=UPI0026072048|nr:hypothetical protein [Nocardia sp.]
MTVTPAECVGAQQDLAAQLQTLIQNASFAGAQTADGTVFTEIVSGNAADLAKISDIVNSCQHMTVAATVLGKQLAGTTVTIETLSLPGESDGNGALAYHTTSQSDIGGQAIPTNSYTGYAVVGSTTVAVHTENLTGKTDDSTFDQIFDSAVAKVRSAT